MPVDLFYREFEAAFRGDRTEIIARLEAYRDFVTPLLSLSSNRKTLDLGCGRGEWLELMTQIGFEAHGVDLDAGMLQDCFDRGLSAEQGDAIAYLQALPENSQAVVSGFHIAEHLSFELLQELVRQALRVLEPAGLLILETPNPENIRVGTMTFHMDPTHNKPLPPGLLSFLARHYGFGRVKVLRLQESAVLREASTASLVQVFEGVSPDYSIVAQKQADALIWAEFDDAFATDHGLTLETLSQRFEAGLVDKAAFEQLRAQVIDHQALRVSLQVQADQLRHEIETIQIEADQLRVELDAVHDVHRHADRLHNEFNALHSQMQQEGARLRAEIDGLRSISQHDSEHHRGQIDALRSLHQDADYRSEMDALRRDLGALHGELDTRLHEIRTSTSWRVTAPLRLVSRIVCAAQAGVLGQRIKDRLRPHALSLALAVHKRPQLRQFVLASIRKVPGLEKRLRGALAITQRTEVNLHRRHGTPQLTPRGRSIYEKLKNLQDL